MQEGIVGTNVVDLAFAAGVAMEMLVADLEHTLMQKSAAVPQISAQLSIMSVWVCPPSLTRYRSLTSGWYLTVVSLVPVGKFEALQGRDLTLERRGWPVLTPLELGLCSNRWGH
mmetsp:Transcript_79574/g.190925  ORF Transcript_79574/g.190925 Transcript_79574/m.190925 type:complete len:114 (-) Transcript_79574:181-522(-)